MSNNFSTNPLISVITPVFSGERHIAACIQSVGNQSYKNIEHIVIDGKSKDNTVSIIQGLQEKYGNLRYVSEQDRGIYDAMNKGIEMSNGNYLFFLGADDTLFSESVIQNIFGNEKSQRFDFIYGNSFYKQANLVYGKEFKLDYFKYANINHQSIFYKRNIFEKIGYFDIKYNIAADWIFNIKCFLDSSISKIYIDTIVSTFNDTGLSNSNARDSNFHKDYLSLFPKLSYCDNFKRIYFLIKPKWFMPSLWLKKLF